MKNLKTQKRPTSILFVLLLSFLIPIMNSCSKEDKILNVEDIENGSDEKTSSECSSLIDFIFNEKDGLVSVEFEDAEFSADQNLNTET